MARIFGFDIGTTSIGFAVVDVDERNESGSIKRLGVRIFPEARDADGTPFNQQRRAKRMARRQLRRRRERRRALNELLTAHNLLPFFTSPEWPKIMAAEPYELRARGLDAPLSAYELGRALYHLSKRRHFQERELAEAEDEKEKQEKLNPDEEKAKTNRDSTLKSLEERGQTLGQFLYGIAPPERRRGKHATRKIVEDEFERLCAAQAAHHPILSDINFRPALYEAIFAQRPVFWRKSTLGKCRFMPGEELCPKGSWLSHQRRMLEKVNNLAIAGGNARPLDEEERRAILAALAAQKTMRWHGGVRKALKPIWKKRGEKEDQHFNLEYGDEKGGLKGNVVEASLAKIFGPKWAAHPHKGALRAFVPEALWQADYGEVGTKRVVIRPQKEREARREALADQLVQEFATSREEAEAIVKLNFPQGWEPFSAMALKIFLPELEKGVRFGALVNGPEWEAWRNANFPDRVQPTGDILAKLPSPRADKHASYDQREEAKRIASLRNPTVVRVQNELRKVVNNLIGLYGKPDMIRVKLARQVGKSKREREEMTAAMRKQERRRAEACKDLEANGIANPSREDIKKWLLWKECGGFCPYTNDPIGFSDLFGGNPRFDVEHIWPKSTSLDNSFANKTLCRKDINIAKGNRIPFDFFNGQPDNWEAAKKRIWEMAAKHGMARKKARRFCAESLPDDFAARQLSDTGYAARQAITFLKRLWPDVGPTAPVNVQAVSGRATAQLRKLWGLNNILSDDGEKTRADHRHHAIDALATACTNPDMTQKLSRYCQAKDDPMAPRPSFDPPWPTTRTDAERAAEAIVVSHRVRKKVSGPLHDEMALGYAKKDIVKNGKPLGVYVKRVPVEKLTPEMLKIEKVPDISRAAKFFVPDGGIRKALLAHLEAANASSAKAYPPYPRVSANGPEIKTVRAQSLQQKDLMAPVSKHQDPATGERLPIGFADPANNHHIAIYRLANGKIDFDAVSLLRAAKRLSEREPIVSRKWKDGAKFIMSLAAGDAIEFSEGDKKGIWIVQGVWANGQVVLVCHNDARPSTKKEAERLGIDGVREEFLPTVGGLLLRKARKLSVDPIGRVRPSND